MITDLIKELNLENGSKYKLNVLKKHKDNLLFKRVLKMTYDKVTFTYGIKKIPNYTCENVSMTLESALDFLENKLNTRAITGNDAINELSIVLSSLSSDDAVIIERVLDRDLKINLGKKQINKVFGDLVTKPPYMRCGIYGDKTASKITLPAIVELKADGMFQYAIKNGDSITFISRQGEEKELPLLKESMMSLPSDMVYVGELLVTGTKDRQESNGLLNSDNIPHERVIMKCWDMISLEEYFDASHSNVNIKRVPYTDRFNRLLKELNNLNSDRIVPIEYEYVTTIKQALEIVSRWMDEGYEGGVLKDLNNIFKDHTSPTQLKLKLEIDADVRITGFVEGKRGTKRENTFGSITYVTDDGKVSGQCSGFTDSELLEFNSKRDELVGKVMTVRFNDVTIAKNSSTYALSHPRYVEIRYDKNETDTLERIFELRDMAMNLDKK